MLKEDKAAAENLNEFSAVVFIAVEFRDFLSSRTCLEGNGQRDSSKLRFQQKSFRLIKKKVTNHLCKRVSAQKLWFNERCPCPWQWG